jgi:hypothetical protein
MTYDAANGYVLLFGGTGPGGQMLGDTWEFNGSRWTEFSQVMPAMTGASMAYDAHLGQVVLFGGLDSSGVPQNETWTWNSLTGWTLQDVAVSPPARYDATLSDVESGTGSFVLYGGLGATATSPATTSTSGESSVTTGPSSVGPQDVPATADDPSAVVGSATLNDTWTWDGARWTEQTANGPPALAGASATWDPTLGEVLMFGGTSDGTNDAGSLLNTLWAWDGASWMARQTPSPLPPARWGATLTYDAAIRGDVLIGGQEAAGPVADEWLYTKSATTSHAWTSIKPTSRPAAAAGSAAAWDSATSQLILFGGSGSNGDASGPTVALAVSVPVPSPSTTTPRPTRAVPPTTAKKTKTEPSTPPTTLTRSTTTTAPSPPPTTTPALVAPSVVSIPSSRIAPTAASLPAPIAASRATSHPGQHVTLSGSGFAPHARIAIWFHSNPVLLGDVTADAAGHFVVSVTVPSNATPGDHDFEAQGLYQGKLESFTTPMRITLPPPAGHSHLQAIILVLAALLVPAVTWVAMAGFDRHRRRKPTIA